MRIEIIKTTEQLEELADEWNELLSCCSASHVPFLRHEYMSTWWKTLGGGEWQQAELFTLIGRDEAGTMLGIAPLFYANNQDNLKSLLLLGSIEISDYLDLIVAEERLAEFIESIFNFLDSEQGIQWQALDFNNIPDTSPTLTLLKQAAIQRGWNYTQETLQPCPYIPIPGDWELYLSNIDKKQRHEIRRKMRRAENHELPVRWYIVEEEDILDQEIEAFLLLMAQDPEKDKFLTQIMRSQMRQAIHAAFRAGWLQLAFLEIDGEKAAGYLNFDYNGHIWVYNSGLRFDYRELSPGWVLLGYLLKWANDNQRESFDFMRGDEDYKYKFGAVNRYVVRALVRRNP
jgi:CelD/BcsL family acetyltransferase involved in cellulose biosynthesis